MADIVVRANQFPDIRGGSTAIIVRQLYQAQIGNSAKPDDKLIALDVKAAAARAKLLNTTALAKTRDAIDVSIAKFTPDNFKAFGVSYKQQNTEITNEMAKLTESHDKLLQEYKQIQAYQVKTRAGFKSSGETSKEEITQLNKETDKFVKAVENYENTYRAISDDLRRLNEATSRLAPGAEKRDVEQQQLPYLSRRQE